MTRHLTHRFWLCAIIGFGGLLLALATRSLEPAALAAPFVGALAFSVAEGWWSEVRVAEARLSAERVVEGDTLSFSLDIQTDQRTEVDVEIQFPPSLLPIGPARFVAPLFGTRTFEVRLQAARWGAAGPEWAVVTSRDRLGLSERVLRHPLNLPVRVHPPAERLVSLVPLYRERPVTGEHRAKSKGAGSEFAEIRPYRHGDSVRMIHPQLSARRGEPMVIERHPDRSSTIVLLVDSAQDLGVDIDTSLRWTITAAMALGERHLRAQDRLGLLDVGRTIRWVPPRLGRRHLHTVIDSLLATEVFPREVDAAQASLPANLPPSATIVAISPLLNERTLSLLVTMRSRGHDIMVIKPALPEPEPNISNLARRIFTVGNELNERWLRERGVTVIPWNPEDSLEHVLRRVLRNLGRSRNVA
ncbi:MAG: DUF58 domain-containing protein [Acidimicrobiia bacterium]|nr:DUF58 domain-containing protein [Acidimicrobiia bacterium]